MQITFKGGAQIVVDADEFKVGRSKLDGELRSLHWVTPDDWQARLHGIYDLGEVVAIVVLRDAQAKPPPDTSWVQTTVTP